MEKCEICNKEFKNNKGGQLTLHIERDHKISFENYYVKFKLNSVEPKCQCGCCNKRPNFRRGKFSKFAIGHNKFEWIEKQHGVHICENPNCSNKTKYRRGIPNKYCSPKCQPSTWNQEKVKNTVKEKYGVDNVFQTKKVKKKSKKTMMYRYGVEFNSQSKEIKEQKIKTAINKYGVKHHMKLQNFKDKLKNIMIDKYGVENAMLLSENIKKSSKRMCEYNSNPHKSHTLKKYKNTKLNYQSLYEYRFLELCENLKILDLINNSSRFQYLNSKKYHIPDFKFKNYIIEIKSIYWLNRQGGFKEIFRKKDSVEAQGYKYILLLDENNQDFLDIL